MKTELDEVCLHALQSHVYTANHNVYSQLVEFLHHGNTQIRQIGTISYPTNISAMRYPAVLRCTNIIAVQHVKISWGIQLRNRRSSNVTSSCPYGI
jgi:hypothetical protein